MATPQFILDLRKKIGNDPLWIPGVTTIILREHNGTKQLLVVQRSDNGKYTPVTGIVDPGEHPHIAAIREAKEETGVDIEVTKVLGVQAVGPVVYDNGDQCSYMDTAFLAKVADGGVEEPFIGDDESTWVGWVDVDKLPAMQPRFESLVKLALQPFNTPTRIGPDDL